MANNIVRILIDLQACQTETSHNRGVDRYSRSLAIHLAQRQGIHDLRYCCNGNYCSEERELRNVLGPSISQQNFSAYQYPAVQRSSIGERSVGVRVAEAFVKHHWLALQPDIIHISHLFEGLTGEAVVPHHLPRLPGLLRSATLYDLIPLRFPEHYLNDSSYNQWYLEKLGILRECDLLLAISESSRKDAIELLCIDPQRVVTVWGGVNSNFCIQHRSEDDVLAFRHRFNLSSRFVLYTGGDDYRKNIEGVIAGFSRLPARMRRNLKLVIVCAIQPERSALYLHKAKRCGLAPHEVQFTGFVSETDLITFYNLCDAFVFPSLYEGFGLPVLEAMACGAPVLGANNSSIQEIIGRNDALFDAKNPDSIAALLAKLLSTDGFKNDLCSYGIQRAREFSWQRSAKLAMEAFQEMHARLHETLSVSLPNSLPRNKLAVFSPLPPCRSGIADYNASFLPFLAKFFEIDLFIDDYKVSDPYLLANFQIRSHRDFSQLAKDYDAVLYEMGNSEFHAYMLPYIEKYPGMVTLHDAYLGGLYHYFESYAHKAGSYFQEMLYSHSTRARRFFAPIQEATDPVGQSMINLPCTRRIIQNSIGIISHSPFNLEVAREQYPEGWGPPYRILKQMVIIPPEVSVEEQYTYRHAFGFERDDFIVCTFGHIVWTKYGDLLLEAFSKSLLSNNLKARLIFAGELAPDEFGAKLHRAIEENDLNGRVRITGYLSDEDYKKYVTISDLAVQLRKNSRGGTPKGVLDCLARGVPVVVNNDASYKDYPDNVVIKLSPTPSLEELVAFFDGLSFSSSDLLTVGSAGLAYAMREHQPENIAAQYATAITEFIERSKVTSLENRIKELGAFIKNSPDEEALIAKSAEALYQSLLTPLFSRRRVLVDVSHITGKDHETGIQRVVRSIVHWLYCSNRPGFQPVAVKLLNNRLVEATEWLDAKGLRCSAEKTPDASEPAVDLRAGDVLLMLDSSWARIDEFLPIFDQVRQIHGKVYTVVYDLLPITFPHYFVPGGSEWFKRWLEIAIDQSDGLVCISRSVADELYAFIRTRPAISARQSLIGYWHLGCDFIKTAAPLSPPTPRVETALSSRSLLMVGSIEPRKRHELALGAMEILWKRGVDITLCIAGKQAWMVDKLMARISHHPQLNKKLYLIECPTDEELHYCYRNATALLFPSAGEGFGLPLIEAAQFGTPILTSDIPVLREIGATHATYFPLGSPVELATVIEEWLRKVETGSPIPDSGNISWLTWEQSAEQLLDVILDNHWYTSSL